MRSSDLRETRGNRLILAQVQAAALSIGQPVLPGRPGTRARAYDMHPTWF